VTKDQASTAAARPLPDAATDGEPEVAGGGIDRLNAFDGLFLRAEHLARMQDYALQLSIALGRACGGGVAEGFGVGLDGDSLVVDPGLAVDPSGRMLRTRKALRTSLAGLTPTPESLWWVELMAEGWDYGDEPVRGVSCADPCAQDPAGSPAAHPYRAEGVRLSLREEKLPTPADEADLDRRGWVAQQFFEREHPAFGAWPGLPPAGGGSGSGIGNTAFLDRRWNPLPAGRGESQGRPDAAVPVALLLPAWSVHDTWQVDIWTVRRDLGAPRPEQAWQPLLGLRPWPVFVAQVLQFQQLLTDRLAGSMDKGSPMSLADLSTTLGELASELRSRRTVRPLAMADELQERLRGGSTATPLQLPSLPQLGLRWLPPAAFLPVPQDLPIDAIKGPSVLSEMIRLLGRARNSHDGPEPILCICRPGDIGDVLDSARHADRIDLDDRELELRVLVPFEADVRVSDWVLVVAVDGIRCLDGR
jgi:hypothetical protein